MGERDKICGLCGEFSHTSEVRQCVQCHRNFHTGCLKEQGDVDLTVRAVIETAFVVHFPSSCYNTPHSILTSSTIIFLFRRRRKLGVVLGSACAYANK